MERESARIPLPKGVDVESIEIAARPAEWLTVPGARTDRAVLYLHGGGYVVGSCRTGRPVASSIASIAACPVLVPDYRLAPEHPFPAAIDDSAASFRWLLERGVPPERIAIAGDSAGGGLALATVLALRDGGGPLPRAIVCFSPWTDLTVSGDSCSMHAKLDPLVSAECLVTFAAAYTAGESPHAPLVSPLYADLRGLPPLLIQVGSSEVLLSDSLRFAEAAREAGVDITLEVWDRMWHVWQNMSRTVPESGRAIRRACSFLEQCWQRQGGPSG